MSLKTRFKNLGNILAQDEAQTDVYVLESPVLTTGMYERIVDFIGAEDGGGDRLHHADARRPRRAPGDALRAALDRIRAEAEEAALSRPAPDRADRRGVRARPRGPAHGAGHRRRARSPRGQGPALLRLDHRALGRVRWTPTPSPCWSASGATAVNAYLAQESFQDRLERGLCGELVAPRRLPELQGRDRGGAAEDPLQDGHQRHLLLSRRLQLRGRGPVARAGGRVLPRHAVAHLRHRPGRAGDARRWRRTARPGTRPP